MLAEIPDLDVEIVPNGLDIEFFSEKIRPREKDPVIMYLGNFTWLQNREAVDVLIKKVWPAIKNKLPDTKLWIIGKEAKSFFNDLSSDNIRVDEVKDIREAYQGAHVLVAPIYSGHGTRLKNFETFASGLPVVTTSIGIGGTEATDGEEVIIRDEPMEIANATIELLSSPALYKKISANALKLVKSKYDWDPIAEKLNKIYENLTGN